MGFKTVSGFEKHLEEESLPVILSGDQILDELLRGGFRKDLTYLLYGDRKITSRILLNASVQYFKGLVDDTSNNNYFSHKVAIVDGNNRFNPYNLGKLAVSVGIFPTKALNSVLISRAFTYEQMIETLEN